MGRWGPLPPEQRVLLASLFLLGPPTCVLAAYLFHLAFERRFMAPAGVPRPALT